MYSNNKLSKTSNIFILAMVCCILWGSAFPSVKIGYRLLGIAVDNWTDQILFAGVRFALAGILVISMGSISQKAVFIPKRTSWVKILHLSLYQTILQYFFYYIGLANTTGVKASIIIGTNVFTAVFLSALFFRTEKLSVAKLAGCIIGFAGIVIINAGNLNGGVSLNLKGDGMVFLSTIASAFSSVTVKKYSGDENITVLSGYQFLIGGIVLTAVGLAAGGRIEKLTLPAVLILIYLSFVSATAYSLWALLLKHNPVSKVAVFGFMNPVFGVILSALFLNEGSQAFDLTGIIALLLVCTGIYTVNRAKS